MRNAQKFINAEIQYFVTDATEKCSVGRRAAPTSRCKNNGILDRIECGRVRKLRTAKNAEKSKKPGNRGEWLERGARISAPYYEKLFWRVVRYV